MGGHAGPCTGPEDIAGCVAWREAPDGLFIDARQDGASTRALHRRRYIIATKVRRPPAASSLERGTMVRRRWRGTEDATSSPHTTLPQPGDQSPCLHCLSVQLAVLCVSACVLACADIFELTCLRVCVSLRGYPCTCVCVCVRGIMWVCVGVLCVD